MRIIGIDPGLVTTGYGIIEKQQSALRFVDAGVIRTHARDSIDARLLKIHKEINEILSRFSLDAAILEKLYAHYKHPLTACLLGHARGAISLCCAQNKIPLIEYGATRVKKAIVGSGHASKLQIQHMVITMLGLKKTVAIPEDVTDALALAIAHSHISQTERAVFSRPTRIHKLITRP